jgi:hypothetical protein
MLAAHPDEVEAIWQMNGDYTVVKESHEFNNLRTFIRELPHQYGHENDEQFNRHLFNILKSIHDYTQAASNEEVTVTKTLQILQDKLGPGFYELEFRRRLRLLRQRDTNAPSD